MFDKKKPDKCEIMKCIDTCVGSVTIITDNGLVFTGIIKRLNDPDNCHKPTDEEEFVTMILNAPLLAIPGSGLPAVVQPFYVSGDTVQLNINRIVTIGPSHTVTVV